MTGIHGRAAVRVTGRRNLLAAIPYLLGFHPADNDIVFIAARRRQLVMIGRGERDWPDGAAADGFLTGLARLAASDMTVDQTILIGYGPVEVTAPVLEIADAVTAAGYPVTDLIHVTGDRYRYHHPDGWVPADGIPVEASTTAAAAELTVLGPVAQACRGDRVALLAHDRAGAAVMRRAIELAAADLPAGTAGAAAVDYLLARAETGARLTDDQAARLILLLHYPPWRDLAWLRTDGQRWLLDLWCDLTRRTLPPLVAPVAALAGWCAWRAGDTVLAQAGAERALDAEPGYRLAVLVADLLAALQPPSALPWPPPSSDPGCATAVPTDPAADPPGTDAGDCPQQTDRRGLGDVAD